jgi:glycosyltransferase involved in cell wall biosynthesis
MKFSICIPQFNRINYLKLSLDILGGQNHSNFEVIISDDCSTDNTEEVIAELKDSYNFPIIYHRFELNQGYDRNLRKSMELATGDYCFILGNDDTLAHSDVLLHLELFLKENDLPDLGFCNYCEYSDSKEITRRAVNTGKIGTGLAVALKYYSCFSFVAGIIIKRSCFLVENTNIYDKSIYSQIGLAVQCVLNGSMLFSINEIWVYKDITLHSEGILQKSNSYRDFINRNWFAIKKADGGLISVINVIVMVLKEKNMYNKSTLIFVLNRVLFRTYPYWILDYKFHDALPSAIGLYIGLNPLRNPYFNDLTNYQKFVLLTKYHGISCVLFLFPSKLFFTLQHRLYHLIK